MLALEAEHRFVAIRGLRVVASPDALEAATWLGHRSRSSEPRADVVLIRTAPDEVFAIDAVRVDIDDPDAIVEQEPGFVAAWCHWSDLSSRLEWRLTNDEKVVQQGALAGVPVKLWMADDEDNVIVVAWAASAPELAARLGWDR